MGETDARHTDETRLAYLGWNLLSTGMGNIDWAGLPIVVEMLGVEDVERFLRMVHVIRHHQLTKGK